MYRRLILVAISLTALALSGWFVLERQNAESHETAAGKVAETMRQEAEKSRFTGTLGDFVVLPLEAQGSPESRLFACEGDAAQTAVDRVGTALRADELWSPAFDVEEGVGWSCPGEGIVLVNNQGMHGKTTSGDVTARIRGYVESVPVKVVRDAPEDRLELITVEGHPALLEHPIEGYPYALASLVVIERFPKENVPGIVVIIERARSAEEAVKAAEEIMR